MRILRINDAVLRLAGIVVEEDDDDDDGNVDVAVVSICLSSKVDVGEWCC